MTLEEYKAKKNKNSTMTLEEYKAKKYNTPQTVVPAKAPQPVSTTSESSKGFKSLPLEDVKKMGKEEREQYNSDYFDYILNRSDEIRKASIPTRSTATTNLSKMVNTMTEEANKEHDAEVKATAELLKPAQEKFDSIANKNNYIANSPMPLMLKRTQAQAEAEQKKYNEWQEKNVIVPTADGKGKVVDRSEYEKQQQKEEDKDKWENGDMYEKVDVLLRSPGGKAALTIPVTMAEGAEGMLKMPENIMDLGGTIGLNLSKKILDSKVNSILKSYNDSVEKYFKEHPELSEEEKKRIRLKADSEISKAITPIVQKNNKAIKETSDKIAQDYVGDKYKDLETVREEYSYLPEGGAEIARSVGYQIPSILATAGASSALGATSKIPEAIGLGVFGTAAGGGGSERALQQGATPEQALAYGISTGAMETVVEALSGFIGGTVGNKFGSKILPKAVKDKIARNVIGKYGLQLLDLGLDVTSEGVEEVISEVVDPFLKRMTYDKDADLATIEDMQNAFWSGVYSSLVFVGGRAVAEGSTINSPKYKQMMQEQIAQSMQDYKNNSSYSQYIMQNNNSSSDITYQNANKPKTLEELIPTGKNVTQNDTQNVQNKQIDKTNQAENKTVLSANMEQSKQNLIKDVENNKYLNEQEKKSFIDTINEIEYTADVEKDVRRAINVFEEERGLKNITNNFNETKSIYNKYAKDNVEYDKQYIDLAKDSVKANNSGKRTKEQWLQVAKNLGNQIYEMSDAEIEKQAFKSWIDNRPNNANAFNRQGKKYVKFTMDDWVNQVYDTVRAARNNAQQVVENKALQTTAETVQNTAENKTTAQRDTVYSMAKETNKKQVPDIKQKQLDIIKSTNPMTDDYHTGIRNVEDIKSFNETLNDEESFTYGDFTREDALKAVEKGEVKVYSSKPIANGGFVSTSYNMAKDYAGSGKVYSETVPLTDVAWINGDEGQLARVENAEIKVNNVDERFEKGLEKFRSGNYNQTDDLLILGETPQYLYNLGMDSDKPIVINMGKLETVMKEPKGTYNGKNQHGITMDIIEQLPQAIQNPLNVIKNPKYNNRLVVITEMTDQYGDIVILPVEMNDKGYIENIESDVNRINTIYGKENYDIPKEEKQKSYIENNKNRIVYDIDKDITKKRSTNSDYRLQLPSTTIDTSTNSIQQNNKSVNTEYAQDTQNDTKNSNKSSFNLPENAEDIYQFKSSENGKPYMDLNGHISMDNNSNVERVGLSQIEKAINDIVTTKVGKFRQKAYGIYKNGAEIIRLKEKNDVPVALHELTHHLDKKYGLSDLGKFDDELMNIAVADKNATRNTKIAEGVAEFGRYYMTDKEYAKFIAPKYYEAFEEALAKEPEMKNNVEKLQQMVSDYLNQSPLNRMASHIDFGDEEASLWQKSKSKISEFKKNFRKNFVDELDPMKKIVNDITNGKKLNVEEDPTELMRLLNGVTGKVRVALEYGIVDSNGNKIGKSLKEIINPVANNMEEFIAYTSALRARDLANNNMESGFNPKDVDEIINLYQNNTTFNKAAKELYKFQNNILEKTLVDSGIITKEAMEAYNKNNPHYVPFYRVMDENFKQGKDSLSKKPKKIKGSTRDIINPIESIIKNTYSYTLIAEKNKIYKTLFDMAKKYDGTGKWFDKVPTDMVGETVSAKDVKDILEKLNLDREDIDYNEVFTTIFKPSYNQKGNIITVMEKGKPVHYEINDKELYDILAPAYSNKKEGLLNQFLYKGASALRVGATHSLEFVFRNPIRDTFTAGAFSENGFVPLVDTIRGIFEVVGKTDLYYKWLESGGSGSTYTNAQRTTLKNTLKDILPETTRKNNSTMEKTLDILLNTTKHPLRTYLDVVGNISNIMEEGTRLGEFRKAYKKTNDLKKSALDSRDITVDFSRGGVEGKEWNRKVAFLNANIQGLDKTVRSFKDRPFATSMKVLAMLTIPSILIRLLQDPDDMDKIAQWEKDTYWVFYINGVPIKIPKPQGPIQMFATLPERVIDFIRAKDSHAFDGLIERTISSSSPIDGFSSILPTAWQPLIETVFNYSIFRQQPIVKQSLQGRSPKYQYDENTSTIAKMVGGATNTSPKKIDNLVSGYFGNLGKDAVNVAGAPIDMVNLLATGGKKENKKEYKDLNSTLRKTPLVKGFVANDAYSRALDDFYDEKSRVSTAYDDAKFVYGDHPNAEQSKELENLKELNSKYNKTYNEIKKINEQIDNVKQSNYSNKQKESMINISKEEIDKKAKDLEKETEELKKSIKRLK